MDIDQRSKVMVIDPDADYADRLGNFCRRYGFDVSESRSIKDLAADALPEQHDLVLLDQFVGGIDVVSYIPALRKSFHGGIVLLTDEGNVADRILALESGADDVICKSVSFREILAKLRAIQRRSRTSHETTATSKNDSRASIVKRNGWTINTLRREILTPNGQVVPLTGLEYEAFLFIFQSSNVIIDREQLTLHLWKEPSSTVGRSLENLISRIRAKFSVFLPGYQLIKSLKGKGYVFLDFPPENEVRDDEAPVGWGKLSA